MKKGDKVLVITGNDKGRTGTIMRKKGDRVVIQGINIRKRHMKKRAQNMPSQIIEMEVPVHISNVCLCDDDGKKVKKVKNV